MAVLWAAGLAMATVDSWVLVWAMVRVDVIKKMKESGLVRLKWEMG
jgi:hypothetical protein